MSDCRICEKPSETPVCDTCRDKAGLPPPAPPLRPPSPCARCAHPEIVRVQMRERSSPQKGDYNSELARPLAMTWGLSTALKGFIALERVTVSEPDFGELFGLVEAYVCRRCGATELFTRAPEDIPLGPEHGTELMVAPTDGAFR